MTPTFDLIFGILVCFDLVYYGMTIQCWKCVSHDCDIDPEKNYKATRVTCNEGEQCMKVRYKMFDNKTHYDSVIRTCTNNPCTKTSVDEFYECVATPRLYMIGGCSLRSCCKDRDLCNSGNSEHVMSYINFVIIVIILLNQTFLC